jgi:arginine decarboxylase
MGGLRDSCRIAGRFINVRESRADRWRKLLKAAISWQASSGQEQSGPVSQRSRVLSTLTDVRQWEHFFSYPGSQLLDAVEESALAGDAVNTARFIQAIHLCLERRLYQAGASPAVAQLRGTAPARAGYTPVNACSQRSYFEVLMVNPAKPTIWPEIAAEFRKLRQPRDVLIYEQVFVSTFEDAALATILNPDIGAAVIYDDIRFASAFNDPSLRDLLASHLIGTSIRTTEHHRGLTLARTVKSIRSDVDIYLINDFSDDSAPTTDHSIRRVFCQVEEPLELHRSILAGIAERMHRIAS